MEKLEKKLNIEHISYNEGHDVLRISFENITGEVSTDDEEHRDIYVSRLDSNEIVGVMVMDYNQKDKKYLEETLTYVNWAEVFAWEKARDDIEIETGNTIEIEE